jgi:hypothetical protein
MAPVPADRRGWVTVSDLSEEAYCPRARWYRDHPPSAEAAREVRDAPGRRAGIAYHARTLRREVRREGSGAWPWVVGALGLLLLVGAALAWTVR